MKKQKRNSKGSRMTYLEQLKDHNAKSKKIINGISQDAIDSIAIATDAVKALNKEGLSPKHYRKFNIHFKNKKQYLSRIDDYYMMQEVLTRRLSRLNSSEY